MNKKDIKFDHSNNIFHDAIGLSKDKMIELLVQSKKIFENIDKEKKSVAVEEIFNIINDMNHKEISVVIFLLLDDTHHRNLLDKMVKMTEIHKSQQSLKLSGSDDDKFNPSYM